ncbi:multicopper oxidase family protein [Hydrogenophaga sp.]|jgi:suppressor of ftsI/bilirubin oxidase|uniref:multicopper oxidase family protein n=1 Tax=Hydrogenophaga sp. TaxID=1904254 RepID=UPI002718F736|nr:multicopper oxidase domain-containing protein [Hydrogenophaga sp.]MDO9253751.1 multicopper oxidase domain-containing protein [Hydrogenophaga sp.]MDP2406317.1 multicopper oxidase domain-containing protein [Hydrogenophaga sp.]MDP3325219.1 multicopper oxidase domain-containing protein [Hydrogenophaga sp.]MDP3886428.1 multicopper oxidase domain-containing protein [Hydrogenophaga sp.]MDZ4176374.1 multicopper oxidase domain-containing protein [Hydrogenophaga sp.]
MSTFTRRHFLGSMGALGAAGSVPGVLAATPGVSDTMAEEITGMETEAAGFANPLRLPGSSGLYGVLPASEFREVHVVRSTIEVLPGRRTPILAYAVESGGKTFLNPALLARRGDEMRVRLINDIDQPTVIHWHGLSVDSRNDGNGLNVVPPGGRMDYAFALRDRASMYWYHPHAHGYIPQQAYHGLASLLFVEDDEEAALRKELDLALGDSEIPLVLQDREFDAQGRLRYAPTAAQSFGGWVGDRLLVNLTERPFIQAGRRIVRFRILNGCNARSYRLAFVQGGRRLGFFLAGTDGGLLAQPLRIDQTFISPGQRLDVLVDLREADPGRPVTLASLAFDPMHAEGGHDMGHTSPATPAMAGMDHSQHGTAPAAASSAPMAMEGDARALMRIDVKPSAKYERRIPTVLSSLPAATASQNPPRRMQLGHNGQGNWTINGGVFDPKIAALSVRRGARETWLIENAERSMPHPMHLHGFPFRVIERLGSPALVRGLAGARGLLPQDQGVVDTVQVWPGESVRIAVDFAHPHAGDQDYVFHCHTLEHAEAGMMLRYTVKT